MNLTLPFPPSVNAMYRTVGGRMLLSKVGRQYAIAVKSILGERCPIDEPLEVIINAHAPDARRRDLDNLLKGGLDSITKAGLWADDSLIHKLTIGWAGVPAPERRVIIDWK